jgi:hypothetical protein
MNIVKTAAYLLLPMSVTVMVPGEVCRQSGGPGTQLRRNVPRDTETRVSSAANWRQRRVGQCTASSIPALEIVTPPKHGTVRFVTTDVGVPRGSGCTNSIYGQAVFYRPDSGFTGQDQFTYNRPAEAMAFNWLGPPAGQITMIVTVREKN